MNQTRAAVAYLNSDSVRSKELEYTAFLTVVHGMDPDKARKRAREIVAKT